MVKLFYECKRQIREGSIHVTSVNYKCEMQSYRASSQVTNSKGEVTKGQVVLRVRKTKLRSFKSSYE